LNPAFCIFAVLDVMVLFHVLLNDAFTFKTSRIDEFEMIQKEGKSWHLPGETEENHDKPQSG
jgi:hypothetical protein